MVDTANSPRFSETHNAPIFKIFRDFCSGFMHLQRLWHLVIYAAHPLDALRPQTTQHASSLPVTSTWEDQKRWRFPLTVCLCSHIVCCSDLTLKYTHFFPGVILLFFCGLSYRIVYVKIETSRMEITEPGNIWKKPNN